MGGLINWGDSVCPDQVRGARGWGVRVEETLLVMSNFALPMIFQMMINIFITKSIIASSWKIHGVSMNGGTEQVMIGLRTPPLGRD